MIYVAIVEDDDDLREGMSLLVNGSPGFSCTGVFRDCETALRHIADAAPDVLLLDIELPGMSGIAAIPQFRAAMPEMDILMLTVHDSGKMVMAALCAGACGYLTKTASPTKLLKAIAEIHSGGAPMSRQIARSVIQSFQKTGENSQQSLTRRESEILALLCKGHSYKMIADALCISTGTVHCHIKNIYKKLQVSSNAQAVARALRDRLV